MTAPSLPQLPLSEEQLEILRRHFHEDVYKPDATDKHVMVDALIKQAIAALTATQRASELARRVEELEKDAKRLDHLDKYAVISKPGQPVRAAIDESIAAIDAAIKETS